MIIVEATDPRSPAARSLLEQSHALMRATSPPEENYFLDVETLAQDDVVFMAARVGEATLGTGALQIKTDYAEIKSMFVTEPARGQGIADALIRALEDEARNRDIATLRLETAKQLPAAIAVYTRHGFTQRDIFGEYRPNASSVYMEKILGEVTPHT